MGWNGLALSSDLKICFTRNSGRYCAPLPRLCFAYVVVAYYDKMRILDFGPETSDLCSLI